VSDVVLKSLDGIEIVFCEGEGACPCCRPGIDQCRLDDVIAILRGSDEAPAFIYYEPNAGLLINVAGEALERLRRHDVVCNDRINLDCRYRFQAGGTRRYDIRPSAGPDDQRVAVVLQAICDGLYQPHLFSLSGCTLPVSRNFGRSVRIDHDPRFIRIKVTLHRNPRKRVPFRKQNSSFLRSFRNTYVDLMGRDVVDEQPNKPRGERDRADNVTAAACGRRAENHSGGSGAR
jgi:hypothetical protein